MIEARRTDLPVSCRLEEVSPTGALQVYDHRAAVVLSPCGGFSDEGEMAVHAAFAVVGAGSRLRIAGICREEVRSRSRGQAGLQRSATRGPGQGSRSPHERPGQQRPSRVWSRPGTRSGSVRKCGCTSHRRNAGIARPTADRVESLDRFSAVSATNAGSPLSSASTRDVAAASRASSCR